MNLNDILQKHTQASAAKEKLINDYKDAANEWLANDFSNIWCNDPDMQSSIQSNKDWNTYITLFGRGASATIKFIKINSNYTATFCEFTIRHIKEHKFEISCSLIKDHVVPFNNIHFRKEILLDFIKDVLETYI